MPAHQIASIIAEGFDDFYGEFMRLTRRARRSFDSAQWMRLHEESQARIDLYQRYVSRTLAALSPITRRYAEDHELWRNAHREYARIVAARVDVEVAETFFNAITRKTFHTVGVDAQIEFLDLDPKRPARQTPVHGQTRIFAARSDLAALFVEILRHPRPALRFVDAHAEARWLAERFVARGYDSTAFEHIEVIKSLFFRPREGYIVARVAVREGGALRHRPLVIAVQPAPQGLVVDALLTTTAEILPVFSSTHSYFFVDVAKPADTVEFLSSLMPELSRSELYVSIAHHRHGKSMIYRELVQHMERSTDRFIIAPGIRGLVMTVFTLPSYGNVFKIIRDTFEKPLTTRAAVKASYRSVFRGQRVGRLADTQEFEHLEFERARFAEACLAELLDKARSTVWVEGDRVVIHHCYIEEKMTPLNLYLQEATEAEACAAIIEYGDAIKELAAHNIFAGDLLWKNFGVNRSGHLVLYDYDEIQPLLEVNFREVPEARNWEDEMAAQPSYAVGDNDVFPEELRPFVVPRQPPAVRAAFENAHADLFGTAFWRGMQQDLVAGRVRVNLPYAGRHPELAAPVRRAGDARSANR